MSNLQLHHSIDVLPPHIQQEVADFVAFLSHKYISSSDNPASRKQRLPLKFGAGKHLIAFVADDFDAPSNRVHCKAN